MEQLWWCGHACLHFLVANLFICGGFSKYFSCPATALPGNGQNIMGGCRPATNKTRGSQIKLNWVPMCKILLFWNWWLCWLAGMEGSRKAKWMQQTEGWQPIRRLSVERNYPDPKETSRLCSKSLKNFKTTEMPSNNWLIEKTRTARFLRTDCAVLFLASYYIDPRV